MTWVKENLLLFFVLLVGGVFLAYRAFIYFGAKAKAEIAVQAVQDQADIQREQAIALLQSQIDSLTPHVGINDTMIAALRQQIYNLGG